MFERAFGFYESVAAVCEEPHKWQHIDPSGKPISPFYVDWAGNFQSGRCPVRIGTEYYHLDRSGWPCTGGPYSYAGDFREGLAVVRSMSDSLYHFISMDGSIPDARRYLDLDVPHKGFARAADERGAFWVDVTRGFSDACDGIRFAKIEPFYNGYARVTTLTGVEQVVDEHLRVAVEMSSSQRALKSSLQDLCVGFWPSFSVKMGLLHNLPALADSGQLQYDGGRKGVLATSWSELGLLKEDTSGFQLTEKGAMLREGAPFKSRAEYWTSGSRLQRWLASMSSVDPTVSTAEDTAAADGPSASTAAADVPMDMFASLAASSPGEVNLSRNVLASYAEDDWKGIDELIIPLLVKAATMRAVDEAVSVVDVGGGSGTILRLLSKHQDEALKLQLTCVDRPEVTARSLATGKVGDADIQFVQADMFNDALPKHADIYILSRCIHDWNDERATRLLQNVWSAAGDSSVLVVIDRVSTAAQRHGLLSLNMHVMNEGRERRQQEWDQLFATSGWRSEDSVPQDHLSTAQSSVTLPAAFHNDHALFVLRKCARNVKQTAGHKQAGTRAQPQPKPGSPAASSTWPSTIAAGGTLLVNHGYPPLYNAGSEIDCANIAHALRRRGDKYGNVAVFSREADVFAPDYGFRLASDQDDRNIPHFLVNNPREAPYSRYSCPAIDDAFRRAMDVKKPEVVHFHHVNHLSVNLPKIAKEEFHARTVFTMHDFFQVCPRGQFLMVGPATEGQERYELCKGQEHAKCARRCFARRFGEAGDEDVAYWTNWVAQRMQAFGSMAAHVDAFTVPSMHLLETLKAAGLPTDKLHYLPYGFPLDRLSGRQRSSHRLVGSPVIFGYIGRHVPAKGLDLLTRAAFGLARELAASEASLSSFRVAIWGRPDGSSMDSLNRIISQEKELSAGTLPREQLDKLVSFEPEYKNRDIVTKVFNHVDAIVVPSIWLENAPLVIHEALQSHVPVITADVGGMKELIHDGVNGFTFKHRDYQSLQAKMRQVLANVPAAEALAKRGYLDHPLGQVPGIDGQVARLVQLYNQIKEYA